MLLAVVILEMMKYFFFLVFIILSACANDSGPAKSESQSDQQIAQRTRLIVNADRLRLRATPGEEGKVIEELGQGTLLYDLGEVSDFTTKIKLGGVQFDEPWLRIETESETPGWVYAGGIKLAGNNPAEFAQFLKEKRLLSLFGSNNFQELKNYQNAFQEVQTTSDMAAVYRQGMKLRDELVNKIDKHLEASQTGQLPDLFWLKEVIPGFVPQLVAEGTSYYLFADYKSFLRLAQKTESNADDQFFGLNLIAFPEDSIEYFFPAWTIQTWDYGGHSLLGRGTHLKLLLEIEKIHKAGTLFESEIQQMKDQLVEDITSASVTYWEPADKIIRELDSILIANLTIFAPNDKIALQTRRKQFEQPDVHGIQTNHRAY